MKHTCRDSIYKYLSLFRNQLVKEVEKRFRRENYNVKIVNVLREVGDLNLNLGGGVKGGRLIFLSVIGYVRSSRITSGQLLLVLPCYFSSMFVIQLYDINWPPSGVWDNVVEMWFQINSAVD
jgi:hypothetical protein